MTPSLWMMISVSLFSVTDMLMKLLLQNATLGQILIYRSLILGALFLIWVGRIPQRHRFHSSLLVLNTGRALSAAGSLILTLMSLKTLSLTSFSAIYVLYPLCAALLAVPVFKEPFSLRTVISFGICIGGVFLITGVPGETETLQGLLFAVLAMLCTAVCIVLTKSLEHHKQSRILTQLIYAGACLGAGVMAEPQSLVNMPTQESVWIQLGALAACQALGFWAVLKALERGRVSHLMPLEYLCFPWALLGDYVFWALSPSLPTLLGCGVIIGGIFLNQGLDTSPKKMMMKPNKKAYKS